MLQSGQEFGEDHWLPEDDQGTGRRVRPRPLRWHLSEDQIGTALGRLYARLARFGRQYPALRSTNFYPDVLGRVADAVQSRRLRRRYRAPDRHLPSLGPIGGWRLQRFYVVLNFGPTAQWVRVPLPANGPWQDLLFNYDGSWSPEATDYHLDVLVGGNWGHIFFREG